MQEPRATPPPAYTRLRAEYPAVVEAYERLGEQCRAARPLDAKTRELVKLGFAIGAGLESGAHAHVRLAVEAGASEEELRHVALLATTTLGFPSARRALSWIEDVVSG